MHATKSDRTLSFQAWVMNRFRFSFSAAVCNAWAPFGGLIDQIDNLGAILNLSAVENVGVALKYYDFAHAQLELSDRGRAGGVDYFRLLPEAQLGARRRFSRPIPAQERTSARPSSGKGNTRYYSNVHLKQYFPFSAYSSPAFPFWCVLIFTHGSTPSYRNGDSDKGFGTGKVKGKENGKHSKSRPFSDSWNRSGTHSRSQSERINDNHRPNPTVSAQCGSGAHARNTSSA